MHTKNSSLTQAKTDGLPRHVAIIMDGNRRPFKDKPHEGHRAGAGVVEVIVRAAAEAGVKYLTLYAFSTENWSRTEAEVAFLMDLFRQLFTEKFPELIAEGVQIKFIGRRDRLPADIVQKMAHLETESSDKDKITVTIALDYGGQDELLRAVQRVHALPVAPEEVAEAFVQCLDTAALPPVDLLIRTGGDQRISNFLLWSIAYAELCFIETPWPFFTAETFLACVDDFSQRQRRFGGDQ